MRVTRRRGFGRALVSESADRAGLSYRNVAANISAVLLNELLNAPRFLSSICSTGILPWRNECLAPRVSIGSTGCARFLAAKSGCASSIRRGEHVIFAALQDGSFGAAA